MIKSHNKVSRGVELHAPNMKKKVDHRGVECVDDQTGHIPGDTEEENVIQDLDECMKNVQASAQVWYNLMRFNGRLIALHKTNW